MARRIEQQRQVPVARYRQPQCLLQQNLPRGGVEQVGTAHHFGHPLCGVIHHHRQLVRPAAVGTAQHEVADLGLHVLLLRAAQAIVEVHEAAGRHAEADGWVRSWLPGDAAMMDAAAGGKVAAAAVADKGLVAGEQYIQRGLVGLAAGALPEDRAIMDQAERGQRLQL